MGEESRRNEAATLKNQLFLRLMTKRSNPRSRLSRPPKYNTKKYYCILAVLVIDAQTKLCNFINHVEWLKRFMQKKKPLNSGVFKSETGLWIFWLEPISKLNRSLQVSDIHQTFCQGLNILLDREGLCLSPTQDIHTSKWVNSVPTKSKATDNFSWEGTTNNVQNSWIFVISGTNAIFSWHWCNINISKCLKRSSKYSLLNNPYIITVFSSHCADVAHPTENTYPMESHCLWSSLVKRLL